MTHDCQPDEFDRLCFKVQSRTDTRRAPYVVDLAANEGRGWCNCKDFATRHTVSGNCKHIRRSRALLLDAVLAAGKRFPVFAQELHRIVRLEWESVMEKNGENEA